jgi:hypothetical protein
MLSPILYIVPEDGDELKQPNCFTVSKDQSKLTLKDIREHFPLPGAYHFRFQFQF